MNEGMSLIKQPLRILLVSFAAAAGLSITVFSFVIGPKKAALSRKEAEYLKSRDSLFAARKMIKNEKIIKEKISRINSDLEKFDRMLPRHEEITGLIRELPVIAEKTGVKMKGVKYQPFVKDDDGYNRLSFSLPIEGGYSNIRRFIYEIETMRKIIWIERLAIKTSYYMEDELSIQLTMSTYFQ